MNSEFGEWLRTVKGKCFDELTTDKAKQFFSAFAAEYNKGALDARFYKGINSSAIEPTHRTKHKWKFASKLTDEEQFHLASVRDEVDTVTFSRSFQEIYTKHCAAGKLDDKQTRDVCKEEEVREHRRYGMKEQRKKTREQHELIMEQVAPRLSGKEAQVQMKKEKSEYTRRERSPTFEIGPGDLYDDGDSFRDV
eukprot:TRINITY_DN1697_c1_g2_i3.p1 TRINITY_DN1697_c1_g2~~TRINITY_DN1697_c1_g2_i3.p1  ORF type:complete len:209 (+),score=43.29 TRINITY_DN1697_c1_g2_i3:47-628(+)